MKGFCTRVLNILLHLVQRRAQISTAPGLMGGLPCMRLLKMDTAWWLLFCCPRGRMRTNGDTATGAGLHCRKLHVTPPLPGFSSYTAPRRGPETGARAETDSPIKTRKRLEPEIHMSLHSVFALSCIFGCCCCQRLVFQAPAKKGPISYWQS